MMDGKRFFLFLTLIGVLGLTSCTGGKKSRCEECPEFTHQNNDFFLNDQKASKYETHSSDNDNRVVYNWNE
jgi:hypothetical protein